MRLSSLIQRIFDNLLSEGSLFGSNPGAPVQCADLNLHVPGTLPGVRLTVAGFWTSVPPASSLGSLVPLSLQWKYQKNIWKKNALSVDEPCPAVNNYLMSPSL